MTLLRSRGFTLIELWTAASSRRSTELAEVRFSVSKGGENSPQSKKGFTLIELLVVVTIIVVLLALLVPAMDQAIYQAELAVCATQMRSVAQGATDYAFEHRRYYMHRSAADPDAGSAGYTYILKWPDALSSTKKVDDRPVHEGYIDLDWLMDPLAKAVDLKPKPMEDPGEVIYNNYIMWYGWQYPGLNPMARMGDRWQGRDPKRNAVYTFDWLLSDMHLVSTTDGAWNGHPDRDGMLANAYAQAGSFEYGERGGPAFNVGFNATVPVTYSFWMRVDNSEHGLMDLNTASADVSVHRLNGVENQFDERTVHLPHMRSGNANQNWLNIARP